jgi:hypothetical protein
MPNVSGIDALVNGEPEINRFNLSYSDNASTYVTSAGSSAYTTLPGNTEWWGQIWGYGGQPTMYPGTQFSFAGNADDNNGYSGTARCHRLVIDVDRFAGTPVAHRAWFRCDGPLTVGAVAGTDAGGDRPASSVDGLLHFGGVDQASMLRARLDITNEIRRTYGGTAANIVHARGNQRVKLTYLTEFDTPANLPALKTLYSTKLYISSTKFWQFNWLQINDWKDVNHPREEQSSRGHTMAAAEVEMGFVRQSGTSTGTIINPAGTTMWPFA